MVINVKGVANLYLSTLKWFNFVKRNVVLKALQQLSSCIILQNVWDDVLTSLIKFSHKMAILHKKIQEFCHLYVFKM
jgi:hypothetical protein